MGAAVAVAMSRVDAIVDRRISMKLQQCQPTGHWQREHVAGLAPKSCVLCYGTGYKTYQSRVACTCVRRAAFRILLAEYRRCDSTIANTITSRPADSEMAQRYSQRRRGSWGNRRAEFRADFEALARRTLSAQEHRVFELYHVRECDSSTIERLMPSLNRGQIFHSIYRAEAKIGDAARSLKPYALFPLHEYYHL